MIYLFSNRRAYGGPFLEAASRYARRTRSPITVVFSGGARDARRQAGLLAMLRRLGAGPAAELPSLTAPDINDPAFLERLEPGAAGIIAGFDQIFRAPAIERLRPFVNFHPSLLPLYRGPEPAYWCIQNGEITTGFTLHEVTTRIDDGAILYQESVPIDGAVDPAALNRSIAVRAAPVLERWLDHLVKGMPWVPVQLDAFDVYRHHVRYASFPKRGAGSSSRRK